MFERAQAEFFESHDETDNEHDVLQNRQQKRGGCRFGAGAPRHSRQDKLQNAIPEIEEGEDDERDHQPRRELSE